MKNDTLSKVTLLVGIVVAMNVLADEICNQMLPGPLANCDTCDPTVQYCSYTKMETDCWTCVEGGGSHVSCDWVRIAGTGVWQPYILGMCLSSATFGPRYGCPGGSDPETAPYYCAAGMPHGDPSTVPCWQTTLNVFCTPRS
jgi:hypothetical protein